MSDVFDLGDNLGDSSFLDTSSLSGGGGAFPDAGFPAFESGSSVIPGFDLSGALDTSNLFASIAPPQNLPGATGPGVGGALNGLSNLVTRFYAGVTQATMAKSASDLAQARAANQLQTVKTTPNVWAVLGIVGAGFFALELMDRGKK